jgi:hypothetical protein
MRGVLVLLMVSTVTGCATTTQSDFGPPPMERVVERTLVPEEAFINEENTMTLEGFAGEEAPENQFQNPSLRARPRSTYP